MPFLFFSHFLLLSVDRLQRVRGRSGRSRGHQGGVHTPHRGERHDRAGVVAEGARVPRALRQAHARSAGLSMQCNYFL